MDLIQSMVRGILTLDGAMGTQLMSRGKSGCFELLNVEQPELVASIHREYIEAGADIIMLDNMDNETMAKAVEIVDGKALLEASGNLTKERLRSVAEIGVDILSIGALTHSVTAFDISMKIKK